MAAVSAIDHAAPADTDTTKHSDEKGGSSPASEDDDRVVAVGVQDAEVYRAAMPRWRFQLRQHVMQRLDAEMGSLERIQKTWRTPIRDEYFVKTSLAGTHTFFMLFLPMWWWYSDPEIGKGLVVLLASGAHITSVLKDALSVPRPYSPPVTRLSVGTHAHEYGFPSTHSSNACSMALYFGGIAVERWTGHWGVTVAAVAFATFFAWSITFGRLYTGMHSISDVVAGSAIGSALWLLYTLTYTRMNALIQNSRWTGTLVSIPTLLVLVTVHPEPVEECPCFEDAVAFLSVVEGIFLREFWTPEGFPNKTYGHKWRTRAEVGMWFAAVLAKLVLGVSWILVWRIVSKRVCHLMLPPLFRFFSPLLQLPRRHYKPATEYDSYSPQESLSPVPSILDLPSLVEDSAVSPSIDRAAEAGSYLDVGKAPAGNGSLRNRANGAKGAAAGTGKKGAPQDAHDSGFSRRNSSGSSSSSSASSDSLPAAQPPKVRPPRASETAGTASAPHRAHRDGHGDESHEHKDADVLTKVITYVGIGYFASTGSQYVFQLLGWSVPA